MRLFNQIIAIGMCVPILILEIFFDDLAYSLYLKYFLLCIDDLEKYIEVEERKRRENDA